MCMCVSKYGTFAQIRTVSRAKKKKIVIVSRCCFDAIIILSCFAFGLPLVHVSS